MAHVFDLRGCGVPTSRLEVQDCCDTFLGEQRMTAPDALYKAQTPEQVTEAVKGDIGIRRSASYPQEQSVLFTHVPHLQGFIVTCSRTLRFTCTGERYNAAAATHQPRSPVSGASGC